jgi:hypothetical protein
LVPDGGERRPSWWERQQEKVLRTTRENPEGRARLEKSWFGRLLLRTAERTLEDWKPAVADDEHTELSTRAERVTLVNQIVSGHLTLTDRRLVFTPALELSWVPWTVRTSEMPLGQIRARKGVFLSRGIYLKLFWLNIVLPGWFHFANLKVKHGRRAWWLRVENPEKWAQVITARGV